MWNAANTISTLGDLDSLNHAQKVFMIGAMFTLLSVGGYAHQHADRRPVERRGAGLSGVSAHGQVLATLTGHVVVAGFGPVGRRVAEQLRTAGPHGGRARVRPGTGAAASDLGYLSILLHAGRDEGLTKARLETADTLVVLIDDLDRKLVLMLIARGLNPKLEIVVTDNTDTGESWLPHAGASRVVLVDDLVAQASLVGQLGR